MPKPPEENLAHLEAESLREGPRLEAKVVEPIARGLTPDRTAEALDRLRELRAGMPPVDAVEIIRASRRELEERFAL